MIIANPIYDAVFKYLMQDKKVAKLMLSAILQMPILDLQFNAQEFNVETDYFSVYRVDFKATIEKKDGRKIVVLIELQKIKFSIEDVFRFRTYLGQQYISTSNVDKNNKPLPIITIYILGHYLENYQDSPILRIQREIIEHGTNKVLEKGKSDFIELLTHDSIIIQIPALEKKKNKTDELEKLLDIFRLVKEHEVQFNEQSIRKDYFPILRRLKKAISDEYIKSVMTVEDEIIEKLKRKEAELLEKDDIIKQEKQRADKEKQRADENQKQLAQKENELKQEKQRAEQLENEKVKMIKFMIDNGVRIEQIKKTLNIDDAFLKNHDLI